MNYLLNRVNKAYLAAINLKGKLMTHSDVSSSFSTYENLHRVISLLYNSITLYNACILLLGLRTYA